MKTVRITATLPEFYIEELKSLANDKKIPSINFGIKQAVDEYLKQIKKEEYQKQMSLASKDKDFLARTLDCAEDFNTVDNEVNGNW